nr:MAG TPA: Replication initiation and membrane attachment [Caudoviricetes sp.]
MARPRKDGLDYYPMDVNFLGDIKVKKVIRSHGIQAVAVILHLLGTVYRDNGYYATYDDDLLFIVADELNLEEKYVKDVVEKLLEVDFFSREQAEKNKVLTSIGIQERYRKATERRISVNINDSLCIQKPRSSEDNVYRSTQSKVKESKVKESKVEDRDASDLAEAPKLSKSENEVAKIFEFYQNNIGMMTPYVQQNVIHWCNDTSPELVMLAIEKAVKENALKFSYAEAILKSWLNQGIKTKAEAVAEMNRRSQAGRNGYQKANTFKETLPDWAKDTKKPRQEESKLDPAKQQELLDQISKLSTSKKG